MLGFDNAIAAFSISLGIVVILLLSSEGKRPAWVRNLLVALIAFSTAVFAASMARFSLLAIMACAALCALLSKRQRRLALSVLAILIASTAFGLIAGSANANLYLRYAVEEIGGEATGDMRLIADSAASNAPKYATSVRSHLPVELLP